MANIGELLVTLGGDSKQWDNATKEAAQSLRNLVTEAQKAGKDLSQFNAQTINLLGGWKNEIGEAYRNLSDSLTPVKKGLVDQGKALSTNAEGITALALQTVVATEKQKIFDQQLKTITNSLWLTTAGLKQFGVAMTTGFTLPIVAAGTAAVKTYADFEKGTVSIQRAANITREQADKITQGFIDISTQVPITVDELQKAGYAAAQAGITGEKAITNFAKAAVMLSKVGGDAFKDLTTEDLSNNLAKISIAFGEAGDNMENVTKISSMLLAVSKAVPGGLGEVIEAMRRAAPMASTLGLNLADTTAIMGTLVAAAVPASRAGTEFGTALGEMVKKSDKVAQALGYSGEQMDKFKKRMDTDLIGVLDELIQRYSLVGSNTEKVQHLQEIFGQVSLKALEPLINNYDIFKDLQARANEELESGTLLAADFDIQANSLSGTFTVFANSVKALANAVGKDLAPYVSFFVKNLTLGLNNIAKAWMSLNPMVKSSIVIFAGLLAIVGPLALLLNTLFLNPIAGILTFTRNALNAATALGATATMGTLAQVSMTGLNLSFTTVIGGIGNLLKSLAILSIQFIAVLAVVALVAAAIYGLAKLFGLKVTLPSVGVKETKLPKTGTPTTKTAKTGESIETTEADEKEAKKQKKALEKQLRDKKKLNDAELETKQEAIDAYKKVMDQEVKTAQDLVDKQKDVIDAKKEAWDDEKRLADEQIDAQDDIVKAAKKVLKTQKGLLKTLEDEKDDEVDKAKGQVEIAKMSLDAAQEALETEVKLGHDEYNDRYQAAKDRVKLAQQAYEDAQEEQIITEQYYDAQIEAQEAVVDAAQKEVDTSEDALDELKEALDDRTRVVEKEIDLLDDELKIRQDSLDKVKKVDQEKLDLLKEEKDTLKKQYDKEEQLIQDRIDAQSDIVDALSDKSVSELPKATQDAVDSFGDLSKAFQDQVKQLQGAVKISTGGIGFDLKNSPILKIGDSIYSAIFGKEKWDKLTEEAHKRGTNIATILIESLIENLKKSELPGQIINFLVNGLIDGIPLLRQALNSSLFAADVWQQMREKAKENGTSTIEELFNAIIIKLGELPGQLLESFLKTFFSEDQWSKIREEAKKRGLSIPELAWQGFTTGMSSIMSGIYQKGVELVTNLGKGISAGVGWIGNAISGIKNSIWSTITSLWDSMFWWGREMIGKFSQGIWNGMQWVKDAIWNMAGWLKGILHFSEPDFGPLKEVENWGKDMMKTYVSAIESEIPNLENTLSNINVDSANALAGNSSSALVDTNNANVQKTIPAGNTSNKTININPGTMIASRGEIRAFLRLLKTYDEFEEGRTT